MEHIHNIREDQNHRIADVTPGALPRVIALVMLVCTATDSQAANMGRGTMNARKSIQERLCGMMVFIVFAAMLAVCIAPALAAILPHPANLANTTGNYQAGCE